MDHGNTPEQVFEPGDRCLKLSLKAANLFSDSFCLFISVQLSFRLLDSNRRCLVSESTSPPIVDVALKTFLA